MKFFKNINYFRTEKSRVLRTDIMVPHKFLSESANVEGRIHASKTAASSRPYSDT